MADPVVTRRGALAVPTFMPDATRAGIRAVSPDDARGVGVQALVVNTLHLLRRPGVKLIRQAGGIHRFMGWEGPIVSDSGGFQAWSLIRQDAAHGVIRSNEIVFREPTTGERWTLTPERVIQLQFQLGSDVIVCLDDPTSSTDPEAEQERSVERTVRWARRSREEYERLVRQLRADETPPLLFGVVQGGAIERLRRGCAAALLDIGFDGYGFGGWPLDADGGLLVDPLRWVVDSLPAGAPKHALGIGRPDHVVAAFDIGFSIFDCALPTRDARHGRLYAFVRADPPRPEAGDRFYEAIRILDPPHRADHAPIEDGCDCPACGRLGLSRAYLHHLFKVGDVSAERLATLHNLRFYARLMDLLRSPA